MRKRTSERREQLIDEAINIIHETGAQGLSVRELASRAGITEGAIYRHFSSKDEILEGIIDRVVTTNIELKARLKLTNAEEKLYTFIFFHLELFEMKPQLVSVIFSQEIYDNKPELRIKFQRILKEKQKILLEIIEKGKETGIYKELNTIVISGMIQGYIRLLINRWKNNKYGFSLKKEGEELCKTLKTILITNHK